MREALHLPRACRRYAPGGFLSARFGRTVFAPIRSWRAALRLCRRNRSRLLFQPELDLQPLRLCSDALPAAQLKSLHVRAEVIIYPSECAPGAAAAAPPPRMNPLRGGGAFSPSALSSAPASLLIRPNGSNGEDPVRVSVLGRPGRRSWLRHSWRNELILLASPALQRAD